jgi:hypothetical protein
MRLPVMRPLAVIAAVVLCGCGSSCSSSSASPSASSGASSPRLESPSAVASPPACVAAGTCPSERVGAAFAFDQDRQVLVVFGGVAWPDSVVNGKVATLNDTWEWSAAGGWAKRTPAAAPSPRDIAPMAYDPAMHEVLLYGGQYVEGGTVHCDDFGRIFCSTDTWAWNGTTWTQLHPPTIPDLGVSTMAFDYAAGQMVLYGFNFGRYGTWIWDGASWSGVPGPSGSPQPGRISPLMAFDPSTRHVVMYGGFNAGGGDLWRMWSWTAGSWTTMQGTAPASAATATDSPGGGLLLYRNPTYQGTSTNTTKYSDSVTWRWHGSSWAQLSPAHKPDVFASAMFDDPRGQQIVLIGFTNQANFQIWAWRQSDWTRLG